MEDYGLKMIILCLFFAIALLFVTLLFILKFSQPFLVVVLGVNLFAVIVVIYCYIMERKK